MQKQKQTTKKETVLVLGAGNFGTCLAQHLSTVGHEVNLWVREREIADAINSNHRNPKYLKEIALAPTITATTDLSPAVINSCTVLLLAVPTQYLRSVLSKIGKLPVDKLLVSAVKGIEVDTQSLPDQIVRETLGDGAADRLVAMSGPSFAIEVATQLPTAVTMASLDEERAAWGQRVFHSPYFRVYTSNDPKSLEVAGALKNIIAIAAGACDGLGYQANSRAAVITRGLAEITRFGVACGANPLSFTGLSGVGDLFLTCSSQKSRNYSVGYRLGQGEKLKEIIATLGSVAEGVATTKAAYQLGQEMKVDMPITTEVYKVLYEDKPIKGALYDLLNREAKHERHGM